MTEPDVALTDYAIALECLVFCVLTRRWPASQARGWWLLLFASVAAGSLIGGTVHGFFTDESTAGYRLLWPSTLIALGVTSACMWMAGAAAVANARARGRIGIAVGIMLLAYVAVVMWVSSRFVVAIAAYLPATVFLLVAFTRAYRRTRSRAIGWGIAGIALTFAAAAVQQLHIGLHPVYFNHNALYHVIQAAALAMIFVGARDLVDAHSPDQPALRR